jgi:hypothetical protein
MYPSEPMLEDQRMMLASARVHQALMAEQGGNPMMAASLWEQAAALYGEGVRNALIAGMPCPDSLHFAVSLVNYHCGRLKYMLGRMAELPGHIIVAIQAIQLAIQQNPGMGIYHTVAGNLLACAGNIAGAMQELTIAVQLNPADGMAQMMLQGLRQLTGAPGVGGYGGMASMGPPMNGMGMMGGGGQGAMDQLGHWLELGNKFLQTADTAFKVINGAQDFFGGSQT